MYNAVHRGSVVLWLRMVSQAVLGSNPDSVPSVWSWANYSSPLASNFKMRRRIILTSSGRERNNLQGSESQMRSSHHVQFWPHSPSFTYSLLCFWAAAQGRKNKNTDFWLNYWLLPFFIHSVLDTLKGNLRNLKKLIFHVRSYYIILFAITCLNLLQVWWILGPTRIKVIYLESWKRMHI